MGLQLATMLDNSGKLKMIMDLHYYYEAFSDLVAEGNVHKDDEALRVVPDPYNNRISVCTS